MLLLVCTASDAKSSVMLIFGPLRLFFLMLLFKSFSFIISFKKFDYDALGIVFSYIFGFVELLGAVGL